MAGIHLKVGTEAATSDGKFKMLGNGHGELKCSIQDIDSKLGSTGVNIALSGEADMPITGWLLGYVSITGLCLLAIATGLAVAGIL